MIKEIRYLETISDIKYLQNWIYVNTLNKNLGISGGSPPP